VQFFLDMEGGSPFQVDPETDLHPDRRLALLRNFFRLGVRGVQLTHNGRNQLADGIGEGKVAGKLSLFGVEVVQEMNRLGMMVGVSHLSAAGIHHVAELTTKPIASTHTNLQKFINTPRQHSDEEVKAIASTGGVIGIRYISNERTPYPLLVDEIDHIAELVGIEHAAIGWEGHDVGHPATGVVPGHTGEAPSAGVESQTMYEHWDNLIALMEERGYGDEQIGMVLGGNFLRIFKEILPDEG
jgi:membrane dipeptidase